MKKDELPTTGGEYLRDPETGALTRVGDDPALPAAAPSTKKGSAK